MQDAGSLRPARRADIDALHRVRLSVDENRLNSRIDAADYVAHLEQLGRGWVIEVGGEIVAFAVGNARDGNIWALFVDPAFERRGFGRRLHDAMLAYLWSAGCERLWLTTQPGTRAQRFYEAAGWQHAGPTASGELRFEFPRPAAPVTDLDGNARGSDSRDR